MKERKVRFFAAIGTWLDDHWIEAASAICSVLFAISGLALNSENLEQFFETSHHQTIKRWAARVMLGLMVPGVGLLGANLRRVKRVSILEDQVQSLSEDKQVFTENVRSLIDGYLVNLASAKLAFGSRRDCSDRITLYSHDEAAHQFVLAGRYSPNPTHHARRRSEYPDDEGCLSRAWQTGSDFVDHLPDPIVEIDEYAKQQHARSRFPIDQARQLTMKSRSYYAYRVMDSRNRKPIAAVVVESTAQNRFTRNQLDQIFNNDERQFMSDLLDAIQRHLIIPSDATKAEF
jgi:hypothetical protein